MIIYSLESEGTNYFHIRRTNLEVSSLRWAWVYMITTTLGSFEYRRRSPSSESNTATDVDGSVVGCCVEALASPSNFEIGRNAFKSMWKDHEMYEY